MFQRNCKLRVFILKLEVSNYELNLQLQFSKKFIESNFETASYYSLLRVELLKLKLLAVNES